MHGWQVLTLPCANAFKTQRAPFSDFRPHFTLQARVNAENLR